MPIPIVCPYTSSDEKPTFSRFRRAVDKKLPNYVLYARQNIRGVHVIRSNRFATGILFFYFRFTGVFVTPTPIRTTCTAHVYFLRASHVDVLERWFSTLLYLGIKIKFWRISRVPFAKEIILKTVWWAALGNCSIFKFLLFLNCFLCSSPTNSNSSNNRRESIEGMYAGIQHRYACHRQVFYHVLYIQ